MKIQELLSQHPELENDKKALEKVLKTFSAPKVAIEKQFTSDLKKELRKKIQERKQENPKYLAFYLHNFRFYFSGFSVAVGCFMILFVLGFFTFNKHPKLLHNPKVINFTDPMAFGVSPYEKDEILPMIAEEKVAESVLRDRDTFALKTANIIPENFPLVGDQEQSDRVFTPAPQRYHIGIHQLPKIPKELFVVKALSGEMIQFNTLLRDMHLPEIQVKKLKESDITSFQLESADKKYHLDVNMKTKKLHFSLSPQVESLGKLTNKQLSEKEIKKIIKEQLQYLGLPLKYYGNPEFKYEYGNRFIFMPRLLQGKEVWNAESKSRIGLDIYFDEESQTIEGMYGFDFGSYTLSKYPISQSQTGLLLQMEKTGKIDISEDGEEDSYSMNKGKIIYLEKGDAFIPALLFDTKEAIPDKTFILPLL